jgi:bacteriocin biosynthesis cyclodehydratase domain-containing protein
MLPLFPSFLRINGVTLASEAPLRFRLDVGVHAIGGIETVVCEAGLYLLSLADGTRTLADCALSLRTELGTDEATLQTVLDDLIRQGLIVDAAAHASALPRRKDRYSRHKLFFESVGHDGDAVQARLAGKHVAVIGVGGIGTWLSYFLAAGGVGALTLIDGDTIEDSNLPRQVLFQPGDVGRAKVEVAAERLTTLRPDLRLRTVARAIDDDTDLDAAIGAVDLMVMSGDSPAHLMDILNTYSLRRGIPWSRCGYLHAVAKCGPLLVPGKTACNTCFKGQLTRMPANLPLIADVNARFQVPSFGPVNGIAASIQAKEAIAWLGGLTGLQASKATICLYDTLRNESKKLSVAADPACPDCGAAPRRARA